MNYQWLGVAKGMRPALPGEVEALRTAYLLHAMGGTADPESIDCDIFVGICDKYITDGPGYAGPVAVVIWPAAPSCVTVFAFRNGLWEVAHDHGV